MSDPHGPTREIPAFSAGPDQPTELPSEPRSGNVLEAIGRAVGSEYEILGEICGIGDGVKGGVAYLASARGSTALDVVHLVGDRDVRILGNLRGTAQAAANGCPNCGKFLRPNVRGCPSCGTRLPAGPAGDASNAISHAEWLEVKRAAGDNRYDVLRQVELGALGVEEGRAGDVVYLSRSLETSRIVALRLERSADGAGQRILGVDQAGVLERLVESTLNAIAPPPVPVEPVVVQPVVVTPQPSPAPLPPPPPPVLRPPQPGILEVLSRGPALRLMGGAAAIIVTIALALWANSLMKARSARNLAADSARADSVRRADSARQEVARQDSVRADSARMAALAESTKLQIASVPRGASITVDTRRVTGPTVRLTPGTHTFSVRAPGYKPLTQTLEVEAGQTLTWPPALVRDSVAPVLATCADAFRRQEWARALVACAQQAETPRGNAAAERMLGGMYERGLGVPQNYTTAVAWYAKGAEHGDSDAEYRYGLLLQDGRGIKRNEPGAVNLFLRSGGKGNRDAQFAAGDAYDRGRGVKRDRTQAADWYRKAGDQGHAEAQVALGVLFAKGDGVKKSEAEAIAWFEKSADQGNERARKELSKRGRRP